MMLTVSKIEKLQMALIALLAAAGLTMIWLAESTQTAKAQDLPQYIGQNAIMYVCPDGTIIEHGSRDFCGVDDDDDNEPDYYYEVNYQENRPVVVYYPAPEDGSTPRPPSAPQVRSNTFTDCEVENPPQNCNPGLCRPDGPPGRRRQRVGYP